MRDQFPFSQNSQQACCFSCWLMSLCSTVVCSSEPYFPFVPDLNPLYSSFSISEPFLAPVSCCSVGCWGNSLALARHRHTCPASNSGHLGSIPLAISSHFHISQHHFAFPFLLFLFSSLPDFLSPLFSWRQSWKAGSFPPAISPRNLNEKILPTFSPCCHTTHHKCWQETSVPSLTFYRALRTLLHTPLLLLAVGLNQWSLGRCGGM